jgi:hypothetical protein
MLIYHAQRAGKRPGILLCHEGSGLGEHAQDRACMLAGLGYVVLAPDLFGEAFRDREHGIAVITELVRNAPALRERVNAAVVFLRAHERVDATRNGDRLLLLRTRGPRACAQRLQSCLRGQLSRRCRQPCRQTLTISCKLLACVGADWQMLVLGGTRHGFTREPMRKNLRQRARTNRGRSS